MLDFDALRSFVEDEPKDGRICVVVTLTPTPDEGATLDIYSNSRDLRMIKTTLLGALSSLVPEYAVVGRDGL